MSDDNLSIPNDALPESTLTEPPMVQLTFHHEQKEVGKLYWNPNDRSFHFEGNVHQSAKVFITTLERLYNERYPEEKE